MPGNDCQEKERGLLTLATARNSILFRMNRERNRIGSGENPTNRKKSPPQDTMKPCKSNAQIPPGLHQLPIDPQCIAGKSQEIPSKRRDLDEEACLPCFLHHNPFTTQNQ